MLNTLPPVHPATIHAATSLGPWHLVALGAGAFITHAYHTVVQAGGLKRLWSNFWNGPCPNSQKPEPPSP